MCRRILASLIVFISFFLCAEAQELSVGAIQPVRSSIKARTAQVHDNNGDLCALLEIAAPSLEGVVFDRNKVVGEVSYSAGVYSVFVPPGTKKLGFRHVDYVPGVIDFDAAGIKVESGETYFVPLQKPSIGELQYQFLVINVTPASALVEVDGQALIVNNGTAQMLLPVGSAHHYRVSANGMYSEEGTVIIDSSDERKTLNVSLQSNTSKVHIVSVPDARIIVNGSALGSGEWTGDLTPGTYRVEAFLDDICIASEVHEITLDGGITYIELGIHYGTVAVTSSEPDANVSIDGNPIGKTPLVARRVLPGWHVISVSLDGFSPATMNILVDASSKVEVNVPLVIAKETSKGKNKESQNSYNSKVNDKVIGDGSHHPESLASIEQLKKKPKGRRERVRPQPMSFVMSGLGYDIAAYWTDNHAFVHNVSAGWVKRFGGYVRLRSTMNYIMPDYSGPFERGEIWVESGRESALTDIVAGGMVRVSKHFYPFLGIGYERYIEYDKVYGSSISWAKVLSYPSVSLELGLLMRFGKVAFSLDGYVHDDICTFGLELGVGLAF